MQSEYPEQHVPGGSSSSIGSCSSGTPRIFALIIGINKFKNVGNLKGAVADANGIEEYLEKKLRVPNAHIKKLLDEDASRANILQAFQDLINNTNKNFQIQRDDAILIYYAGHGQLVDGPKDWPTGRQDRKIQSIVPHDLCTDRDNPVDVITDITLGALIQHIAGKWGNNITIIFDCCHSGSGTRENNPNTLYRSAMLEGYSIRPDLDQDLLSTLGGTRAAKPVLCSGAHDSHVFLAACSSDELAREECGRGGNFTLALLKFLKEISPGEITYGEVLDRLEKIKGQNPQLEGTSSNCRRTLFRVKATYGVRNHHRVSFNTNSRRHELDAGAAHGVCKGAEFKIYSSMVSISEGPVLGVGTAESVEPFCSILAIQPHLQPDPTVTVIAIQTKLGEGEGLKLHLKQTNALYDGIQKQTIDGWGITLVDQSAADLEIVCEGNKLAFNILDKDVTDYGLLRLSDLVDPELEDVMSVLWAAAHYYRFLKRDRKLHRLIQDSIDIQFLRLEHSDKLDDYGRWMKEFVGNNLIEDGKIVLVIENEGDLYGIKITNKSCYPLHVNVFFFSSSDLSINSYYSSGGGNQFERDASLNPSAELALGYGPAGAAAYTFWVPEGQDVDVGILKFFFSTSPVDLSAVEQKSPFRNARGTSREKMKPFDFWGTICIPCILRRPNSQQ